MDPGASPEDTPRRKGESVRIGSADSDSSPETNRSLIGCDTKLIECTSTADSNLRSKESDNPLDADPKKSKEPREKGALEELSSTTRLRKSAQEAWLDKIGIQGNVPPKFSHYSELQDRLKSFSLWTSQNQQPSVLSEAGFFYIGVQDRTACFHCGGGLREWKSTDDPWIEHAHWFPNCNYVRNVKGQEFVDQAWRSKLGINTPKEMKDAADVLKDLFDVISPKSEKTCRAEKVSSSQGADSNMVASSKDSFYSCQICYERERDMIFLPCRHMVSCCKCASALTRCVICRATINDLFRAIPA